MNKKREPRSVIFGADARHVLFAPDPRQLQQFAARLMDRLFTFAVVREDDGLAIYGRRFAGTQARARAGVPARRRRRVRDPTAAAGR